jgi:hypothetical protein
VVLANPAPGIGIAGAFAGAEAAAPDEEPVDAAGALVGAGAVGFAGAAVAAVGVAVGITRGVGAAGGTVALGGAAVGVGVTGGGTLPEGRRGATWLPALPPDGMLPEGADPVAGFGRAGTGVAVARALRAGRRPRRPGRLHGSGPCLRAWRWSGPAC